MNTTKGWDLLIKWKDGLESRIILTNLKKYNTLDIAEYTTSDLIDKESAFAQWIKWEMKNVSITSDVLDEGKIPSAMYKRAHFHMVYDVNMDFTRKTWLVAEGRITPNHITSTYEWVVSRESVRVVFAYAALNDIKVWTVDFQNAYGLKSTGAYFRNHLCDYIDHPGYESCKNFSDVYIRSATISDGMSYF